MHLWSISLSQLLAPSTETKMDMKTVSTSTPVDLDKFMMAVIITVKKKNTNY